MNPDASSRAFRALSPILLSALALAAATTPATAQTLYTLGGTFVHEQNGGPAGCGYPNGPAHGSFGTQATLPCGALGTIPPAGSAQQLGDVAVDRVRDHVWVTDGTTITSFTPSGTPLVHFDLAGVLPAYHGQITGLGFDGPNRRLWLTNGTRAASILPPTTCFQTPWVVHEFALPAPFAPYYDLDWHGPSNTLFCAGASDFVTNVDTTGAYGPYGFNAVAVASGVAPPYTGLAIDASGYDAGWALYLTDGVMIERVEQGFGFTSTVHWQHKIRPVLYPGTPGLAWSAHALTIGTTSTLLPPTLNARGNSVIPNPEFAATVRGGAPGDLAAVYYAASTPCTPTWWSFVNGYLYIDSLTLLGFGWLDASGNLDVPAPIPSYLTTGTTLYCQGFVATGGSTWHATNGVAFSLAER